MDVGDRAMQAGWRGNEQVGRAHAAKIGRQPANVIAAGLAGVAGRRYGLAMSAHRSSGDAVADRRYAYAMQYRAADEPGAAAELIEQALELAPGWAAGWVALGEAREAAGAGEPAASAYRHALELDPADTAGARARLARLGEAPADGAVTPAHVAALFDDYAARFEASLVGALAYRGPALLRQAVTAVTAAGGPARFDRAVDLGCGTGLAAEAFADLCARIDGVDLSANMLAAAAGKGLYASLTQASIDAYLEAEPAASADLVLAADVLVYLGDLGALFVRVARVLRASGRFAFTVQTAEGGGDFVLGPDLRYAHGADAVRRWAAAAGLAVRMLQEASTRTDAGRPVPGLLLVLEKPETAG